MSGATGPVQSMPSSLAASTAGAISSRSSRPNMPFSPQCGLSPATPTRGFSMPSLRQASAAMRMQSSTRSFFTRSQASRSETCVETWTTRMFSCTSIMVYFLVLV